MSTLAEILSVDILNGVGVFNAYEAVVAYELDKAWVAYEDVPNKLPVNSPVNEPLNDPVLDKNWSTRFAVTIRDGMPGTIPNVDSACKRTFASGEYHISWK